MIIRSEKYLLATKKFPLQFDSKTSEGEMTDQIEDAYVYDTERDVDNELGNFDHPEEFQAIKVIITYEI
jgi:hypothetical protein